MVNGKEVVMQRFISNFIPINEFLETLPGDQDFLPYVAQLGLILLEEGQTLLIESEDLTSAFNLFRMPDAWLPYFSYAKKVAGRLLGSSEEWVRPALRVIPMVGALRSPSCKPSPCSGTWSSKTPASQRVWRLQR